MLKKELGVGLALILLLGSVPVSTSEQVSLQKLQPSQISDSMSPELNSEILNGNISEPTQVNQSGLDAEGKTQDSGVHLVVKLSPGTSPERIAQSVHAELARKGPLQFITLALETRRIDEVMSQLKSMPGVLKVSPSQEMKLSAAVEAVTVNDPYFSKQWNLTQAQVPEAWNLGATGDGIIVAVVDTGVDVTHPDLQDNLIPGYNAITEREGLVATQDNNGHGTHVAGIIGAERDGSGIIGVAYEAKIMPIKAMNRAGEGMDYVIADGIVWAADHGASIINLSIGTDTQEEILKEAIQYAKDQGCLVIAAAGNKNEESTANIIIYPAADPQVLAVTATDEKDQLASFSLTGPHVSLTAPGTNIPSDFWQDGSSYALSDGTSMAAPFVAGVAALVWSEHPDFSASQVRQILEESALDLGTTGRDSKFGYGRVNAYWALKFATEPTALPAPAIVSWAGGIVQGDPAQTFAELEIPSRAFGKDPTQELQVRINPALGTLGLPSGVNPVGEALNVAWETNDSSQKYLQLSLTPDSKRFTPDSSHLLYIYYWSGERWLKVGGGMQSGTVTVGITEPGIYQLGSARLPQTTRLAGADRIETALQISQTGFLDGADTVLLARAEDFPDALAGAPLAYKKHAPILLTNSTSLPENVQTEIQRLNPQQIILLGGTGAVSGEIESLLESKYSVTRLGGANRYATAQQIALALGMTGEAVLVNGDNFPDAIAMSSIAAQYGVPILLTSVNNLPPETDQALRHHAVTGTVVAGGKGVVSQPVFEFLPSPFRLSGADRYATAAKVLKAFPPQGGMTFLATGENFPDALTGGVLAAVNSTNLILVSPEGLKVDEQDVLEGWSGKKVFAFGGSGVISDSLLTQIQTMLQ